MKPSQHVAVSAASGLVLGWVLRSWTAGAACFLMGVFIDLDHYFDFWLNRGFSLDPRKLLDFCYYGTSRKFYDILHGYEYIPFYWALTTVPGLYELGWGLTVGYTLHLLGDQFFNHHLHRWTYFLSFRVYHRFEHSKIVLYNPFVDNTTPARRGGLGLTQSLAESIKPKNPRIIDILVMISESHGISLRSVQMHGDDLLVGGIDRVRLFERRTAHRLHSRGAGGTAGDPDSR